MVEYDPGPPPAVADHLARTSSGTTGDRSSTADDLIDRRSCSASPQIPGQQSESPAVRWLATQASVSRVFSANWA